MAFPSYSNVKRLKKLPVSQSKSKHEALTPKIKPKAVNNSYIREHPRLLSEHASVKSLVLSKANTPCHTPGHSNASSIDFDSQVGSSALDFDFFQSEYGLRKYAQSNKAHFLERVSKGPPKIFRWLAWMICAETPGLREKLDYLSLLEREIDEDTSIQIEKDISRTLSEGYEFFQSKEAQNALFRLLKAVAAVDPKLGYCQGMNFIAGFVLAMAQFDENDSFYLFSSILSNTFTSKLGVRGFFLPEFPLLRCYLYVFDRLFEDKLPKLYAHFKEIEIPEETWISKWFQTLFTICLPPTLCSRLWDCLLVNGKVFLLNFSIALLRSLSKRLLQIDDVVDLADFFKKMNPYTVKRKEDLVKLEDEDLIRAARKEKIPQSTVNKLVSEYETDSGLKIEVFEQKYELSAVNQEIELTLEEEFAVFNRANDRKETLKSKDNRSDMDILKCDKRSNFAKILDKHIPLRSRVSKHFQEELVFIDSSSRKNSEFNCDSPVKKQLTFDVEEVDSDDDFSELNCEEGPTSTKMRETSANMIFNK